MENHKPILITITYMRVGGSWWGGGMGGGNVNYCKNVHHLICTRGNREYPGSFQNKSVSSPFS